MSTVLRTSEFWLAVAGVLGQIATGLGWVSPAVWNAWAPSIVVYVVARLVSKFAKSQVPSGGS